MYRSRRKIEESDAHVMQFRLVVSGWEKTYDPEQSGLQRYELWEDLKDAGKMMIKAGIPVRDIVDILDGIQAKSNGQFPLFVNCLVQKVFEAPMKKGGPDAYHVAIDQCMAFARTANSMYTGQIDKKYLEALAQTASKGKFEAPNHSEFERVMQDVMRAQNTHYDLKKKEIHSSSSNGTIYRGSGTQNKGWNEGKKTKVIS
jgi:hypothetical protein